MVGNLLLAILPWAFLALSLAFLSWAAWYSLLTNTYLNCSSIMIRKQVGNLITIEGEET